MSLSTGQSLAFFGAGAAYQSPKYPKKFAFYDINLAIGEIKPWTYTYRRRGEYGLEDESSQPIKAVLPWPLGMRLQGTANEIVSFGKRALTDIYKTYYGEYYTYNWAIRGGHEISEKKLLISRNSSGFPEAYLYINEEYVTLTYHGIMRADRRSLYFDLIGEGHAEEVRLVFHEPLDKKIIFLVGVFAATTLDSDPLCGKVLLSKQRLSYAVAKKHLGGRRIIVVDSKHQRNIPQMQTAISGFINSRIT
jgi:hypothetical protein